MNTDAKKKPAGNWHSTAGHTDSKIVTGYREIALPQAREALGFIPADLPRDEWVRVGMAAHAAGLTMTDWLEWSAQAESYNERAARDTWKSIKPGKIGTGTLFKIAADHGYNNGKPKPATPKTKPAKVSDTNADAVWSRCKPATDSHPYIIAKGADSVPLDGLRVVPDNETLRIADESMAGALVVPVRRPDGTLASLQFITPPMTADRLKAKRKPGKLNLPGANLEGWHSVGVIETGGVAYVCEGIGQAWACWKATGEAAVVAFGWGRVRGVTDELRKHYPNTRLVLVPDTGKESDAAKIAAELSVHYVTMPEGWPPNSDVSDLAQRDGFDVLDKLLCDHKAPELRYKLLSGRDLASLPALRWRVRGVLPAQGVAAIYGPSGSGKSFLALDVAAAIADGQSWFGCRVSAAPVVYCALEGEAGFRARVQAWEAHNEADLPDGLRLMLQQFKLTDPLDVRDLAAVIQAGAVVFIDTLNRAAPTADENSSQDMGQILEAVKLLQSMTGGLVCLVHHTGKDSTKGLRGHSSLIAALDAAVEVARDGDRRTWTVAKSKDGQDGIDNQFSLRVVTLGDDEFGDPVTSCVVEQIGEAGESTRPRVPKGGNQRIIYNGLGELLRHSTTFGKAGAPPTRPCVELEEAVETLAPRLTCEPVRRKERTRQALTGLIASGVICCREGWLWVS